MGSGITRAFFLVLPGILGKRLTDYPGPSAPPRMATESTEDPTHSPSSCCSPSPHSAYPVFIRNSPASIRRPWGGGGSQTKKVVRGSVDSVDFVGSVGSVAIQSR